MSGSTSALQYLQSWETLTAESPGGFDGEDIQSFELVYRDIAVALTTQVNEDGAKYIRKFNDHHTRWKALFPISSESEALETYTVFYS